MSMYTNQLELSVIDDRIFPHLSTKLSTQLGHVKGVTEGLLDGEMIDTKVFEEFCRFPKFLEIFLGVHPHLKKAGFSFRYFRRGTLPEYKSFGEGENRRDVFIEGKENLTLFYEERPVCTIGFERITRDFAIIYNIQCPKGHNNILDGVEWQRFLAKNVEELMRLLRVPVISILPSDGNVSLRHPDKKKDEVPENQESLFEKTYDKTAENLGYKHYENFLPYSIHPHYGMNGFDRKFGGREYFSLYVKSLDKKSQSQ